MQQHLHFLLCHIWHIVLIASEIAAYQIEERVTFQIIKDWTLAFLIFVLPAVKLKVVSFNQPTNLLGHDEATFKIYLGVFASLVRNKKIYTELKIESVAGARFELDHMGTNI